MTQYYIPTTTNSIYTNNTTTVTNDYFRDWANSTTGTGTTYTPYWQTYTVPYDDGFTGRQAPYHQIVQDLNIEPQQQIPQKSPEQIKEENEASERAKTLLLEYLDEDNKRKFLDKKRLEISSRLFGGVKYHIPLSKVGRIKVWKDDNMVTELCLLVKETEQLPAEDVLLTKLLHILHDEKNMLKTAHHFNVKENLLLWLN